MSDGNSLFPAEISIEDSGLSVKIPGFLSGKNTFLPFANISSVSVDTPMVGYSTVSFSAQGTRVRVHGFTKSEVEQIKGAIDEGQSGSRQNAMKDFLQEEANEPESVKLKRLDMDKEEIAEERRRDKYSVPKAINLIKFGKSPDSIISEIDLMITNTKSFLKSSKYNTKYIPVTDSLTGKIEEGIKKLSRIANQEMVLKELSGDLEKLRVSKAKKDRTTRIKFWGKYVLPPLLWAFSIQLWRIRHIKLWILISVTVAVIVISLIFFYVWLEGEEDVRD